MRVIPGQIWQDLDKRMAKRQVRVLVVDKKYAYVENVEGNSIGRKTRISLRRMRPIHNGFIQVLKI